MTGAPLEPVERCKRVPLCERSEMSRAVRIDAHQMVYVTELWSAFDALLAENAKLASSVRAGEAKDAVIAAARKLVDDENHADDCASWDDFTIVAERCDCDMRPLIDALKSLGAEESARASGAIDRKP